MAADATVTVTLGFLPESLAVPDDEHPGLLRAGPRASAPYGDGRTERHACPATDLLQDPGVRPDLFGFGFDTVDLAGINALQEVLVRVRDAGRIDDADASVIRSALDGAVLPCSTGSVLTVLHVADEGLIMRTAGPNGMSVVGPRSRGMNDHGGATSVHADQDVFGTPLSELMDGRAPTLFRHHSPDGANDEAGLMLVNLWIPLHQITQPLTLADGRSIDRRRHQLRYGLPTDSFLEREDAMGINDIWTFLHDPSQDWYFRSDMDHRQAYVFDTLSTAHGACTLPEKDLAEQCYLSLVDAEAAVLSGDVTALAAAVRASAGATAAREVPRSLHEAIAAMVAVADEASREPAAVCGERAERWLAASREARGRVIRRSLELRMVVSFTA